MGAVPPGHVPQIDHPNVDFVDKRRGLECMADMFPGHMPARPPVKLLVDKRSQLIERLRVAFAPGPQELRDVLRRPRIRTALLGHSVVSPPAVARATESGFSTSQSRSFEGRLQL